MGRGQWWWAEPGDLLCGECGSPIARRKPEPPTCQEELARSHVLLYRVPCASPPCAMPRNAGGCVALNTCTVVAFVTCPEVKYMYFYH